MRISELVKTGYKVDSGKLPSKCKISGCKQKPEMFLVLDSGTYALCAEDFDRYEAACKKADEEKKEKRKNVYGFLWHPDAPYYKESRYRHRNIKARNLKSACTKMKRILDGMAEKYGDGVRVDEDVDHNDTFMSLRNIKHPIQTYLP
jgi:hypothetical protein